MATGTAGWTGWLLHHTAGETEATGLRGALGESWLIQLSVVMHTIGALLIMGALVGVIVAYRRRVAGEPPAGWTSAGRLRGLIAAGWLVNLVGGTMRLLQPDHPPLSAFNEVAWVQVLTVKHVILIGAILASVVAVGLGPLAWRRFEPQSAGLGIALVLLAAVLGGASTTLPLPGMDEGATGPVGLPSQPPGHHVTSYSNFTLPLAAAGPLTPFTAELPFDVDPWVFALTARVSWATEQNLVQARVVDSEGRIAARLNEEVAPATIEARMDTNLFPGGWMIVLESEQVLVPENAQIMLRFESGTHMPRVFEDTVTVRADDRFLELNFWMDEGDYFTYNWSVPTAYGAIDWDIHSHPEGDVRYHLQSTDRSADGNFTASRDRIYSILWVVDPEAGALSVTYRVEGTMRLHSVYP